MFPYYIYSLICKEALAFTFNYIKKCFPPCYYILNIRDRLQRKAWPRARVGPWDGQVGGRRAVCLRLSPLLPQGLPSHPVLPAPTRQSSQPTRHGSWPRTGHR